MVTHHYTEIDIAYIIYPIDIDIYKLANSFPIFSFPTQPANSPHKL